MNEIGKALHELNTIDAMAKEDKWLNQIHPLMKLILTIFYITVTVSIPKYDMQRTLSMLLYPLVVFVIGEIPVKESLYRLRVVLPLVCIVGVLNPFFDHTPITKLGNLIITGGIISMLTLMMKGVLTVLVKAAAQRSRALHVPAHGGKAQHRRRICQAHCPRPDPFVHAASPCVVWGSMPRKGGNIHSLDAARGTRYDNIY